MSKSVLLWFVAMCLVCVPVYATETQITPVAIDEVVVTATRQLEDLSSIPANITVISQDEIKHSSAQSVPELLRTVPGILVNDVAGNGRNYTVDLRGFGETASLNTLVLVDGRRINQADLSGVDWTLIPKDRVARIEIVRGGRGSILYGDNAAAGVINIITKTGEQQLLKSAKFTLGSYQTYTGDLSLRGTSDNVSYALNTNYRKSDGYRDNSDTEAKDFGLDLVYDLSESTILDFSGGYHDDQTSLPGALTKSDLESGLSRRDTVFPDDYADTEDWYLKSGAQLFVTDNSYLELNVSMRNRESQFFSFFIGGEYEGDTDIDVLTFSPQLVLNEVFLGQPLQILLGLDYEETTEDIVNKLQFPEFPAFSSIANYELSRDNLGYYTHIDVPVTDNFAFSTGFRREEADYDFDSLSVGTSESRSIDENLYTLGSNYRYLGNSSVFASYSKSFRFPVLDEMFSFTDNSVNKDLNAQTSDNLEVGVRTHFGVGTHVNLTYFRIETEDEIFYNPSGGDFGFGANENFDGETIRQGIEFSAGKTVFDAFLRVSYTFTDAEVDGGQYDGNDIPNVPEHMATLAVQKKFGPDYQLDINGVYVGERRFISDFANVADELEDYVYVSAKVSYLMNRGSIFVVVNNLLDQEYSEYGALNFAGEEGFYPSPKINVFAGVDVSF